MSHYLDFKTQVTDPEALVKALGHMKNRYGQLLTPNKIEVHDAAANLYGYQGDVRQQKAHIIIRRDNVGGSSNDIGFVKDKDGFYSAIISEFDSSHYDQEWQNHLYTYYNYEKAKMACIKEGKSFVEGMTADGRLELRARFKKTSTEAISL